MAAKLVSDARTLSMSVRNSDGVTNYFEVRVMLGTHASIPPVVTNNDHKVRLKMGLNARGTVRGCALKTAVCTFAQKTDETLK